MAGATTLATTLNGFLFATNGVVSTSTGLDTSVQGTANQVLVNNTAGTPQTGALTLTLATSLVLPGNSITQLDGSSWKDNGSGAFTLAGITNTSTLSVAATDNTGAQLVVSNTTSTSGDRLVMMQLANSSSSAYFKLASNGNTFSLGFGNIASIADAITVTTSTSATSIAGNLTTSAASGSNAVLTLNGTPSANTSGYSNIIASNASTNWQIATNNTVGGDFEIIPSTTTGGSTFTTPTFKMLSTGALTLTNTTTISASGGEPLILRSAASTIMYMSLGRSSEDARFTIAQSTNDGVTGSSAGDIVFGSNATIWMGIAGTSVGHFTSTTLALPGTLSVASTTASTSTSTGALVVGNGTSGGLGVGGAIWGGTSINLVTSASDANVSIDAPATTNAAAVYFKASGTTMWYMGRGAGTGDNNFYLVNNGLGNAFRFNNVTNGFTVSSLNASAASWTTLGYVMQVNGPTATNSSTAASGTAASAVFTSYAAPTLAATNTGVITTTAATVYIAGAPIAGTNQTITNPYALWSVGNVALGASATDVRLTHVAANGRLILDGSNDQNGGEIQLTGSAYGTPAVINYSAATHTWKNIAGQAQFSATGGTSSGNLTVSFTTSGTSTTAASILGKSLGLTENLFVGGTTLNQTNSNAGATVLTVSNPNIGTAAISGINLIAGTANSYFYAIGSGYTTSGRIIAGSLLIENQGAGGLVLSATTGNINFWNSGGSNVATIGGTAAIAVLVGTDATTGGAGSLTTAGGIYATKQIISAVGITAGATGNRGFISTVASGSQTALRLTQTSVTDWEIQNVATTGILAFAQSAGVLMSLAANGNLTVSGSIINASDSRLKTAITSLSSGLDLILKLNPVSYHLNSDLSGKTHWGLVAQEVMAATGGSASGLSLINTDSVTGMLGLSYTQLIPVLIRGEQELHAEIKALKSRIYALENLN